MNDSIIAQRIRHRMKELGINARKLAQRANVGKSFIYDVLSRKSKNPTSSKLALISKELGVSMSYLIGDNDINIDTQNYVFSFSLSEENAVMPQLLLSKNHFYLSNKENLKLFNMIDNSMSPILLEQDILIINTTDNTSITGDIFALKYKRTLIIRKLQHIVATNKVKVIAENQNYLSYEEDINKLNIIGRLKYFLRKL